MKLQTITLIMFVGMFLSFIGMILNFNVMIKNDGTMPVKIVEGMDTYFAKDHYSFYEIDEEIDWKFATDKYQLPIPKYIIMFSLGDLLILLGLLLFFPSSVNLIWRLKRYDL